MNLTSKVKSKLEQDGLRGVIAGSLRHIASRIERRSPQSATGSEHSSEFLAWVRLAVPGMLTPGNISAMEYAVTNMPAGKAVLEIGSFCGLSTVVLSHLLDKHGKRASLYTCDKWEFEGQHLGTTLDDSTSVTHDAYRAYVRSTFLRTIQTFTPERLPHTIECFSDEFFRRWLKGERTVDVFDRPVALGGEIAFCYIDGNHTYEYAKRDFENTNRVLVPGGFILFDDSADGSGWEVNRLTREIAARSEFELISRNPNYLFRKR